MQIGCFQVLFIHLFDRVTEAKERVKRRGSEREIEIFIPLLYAPNAYESWVLAQAGVRKQELPLGFLHGWQDLRS